MIDIAVLKAMAAAGATADMIIAALEADRTAEDARRADAAARKRRSRARTDKSERENGATSRDLAGQSATSRDVPATPLPSSPYLPNPATCSHEQARERNPAHDPPSSHLANTVLARQSESGVVGVNARHDDNNFDKPERERATRLSKTWEPNGRDFGFAARELGGLLAVEQELAKFRDYWDAKPGQDGRKLNWDATWRNWVRQARDFRGGRGPPQQPLTFIDLENELHAHGPHGSHGTDDLLGEVADPSKQRRG